MSSVVIAGDTSGSVTLQAPATAGSTVLTLPATSGTVVTTATSSGISGSAITTGTVGVSVGGTGANTLTANNVILGNGTSAVQFVAPGSNGNVLTSNGTTWTSAAASGYAGGTTELITSTTTWTVPTGITKATITIVAGGGGGSSNGFGGCGGGGVVQLTGLSGSYLLTIGTGGAGSGSTAPGSPGTSSSFGSLVSCTGGAGGTTPTSANGALTVTTGTKIRGNNLNLTTATNAQIINIYTLLASGQDATGQVGGAFSATSTKSAGMGSRSLNTAGMDGAILIQY